MAEIRVTESSNARKAIFVLLFLFAVLNHVVRALSTHARGGVVPLTEWDPTSVASLLGSMNGTRVFFGNKVSHLATYCPASISEGCSGVTTAFNYIFGLSA